MGDDASKCHFRVHMAGQTMTQGNWNAQVKGDDKPQCGMQNESGPTDLKEVAHRLAVT